MKKIVIACLMLGACSVMETKIGAENNLSAMETKIGAENTLVVEYNNFLEKAASHMKSKNKDEDISFLKDTFSFDTYNKMMTNTYHKNPLCEDNLECIKASIMMYLFVLIGAVDGVEKKQKEKGIVVDRDKVMDELRKKISFDSFYEGFYQCTQEIKSEEEIISCMKTKVVNIMKK
jgi:hypothetical protein